MGFCVSAHVRACVSSDRSALEQCGAVVGAAVWSSGKSSNVDQWSGQQYGVVVRRAVWTSGDGGNME